jgi:hypothetical protein
MVWAALKSLSTIKKAEAMIGRARRGETSLHNGGRVEAYQGLIGISDPEQCG